MKPTMSSDLPMRHFLVQLVSLQHCNTDVISTFFCSVFEWETVAVGSQFIYWQHFVYFYIFFYLGSFCPQKDHVTTHMLGFCRTTPPPQTTLFPLAATGNKLLLKSIPRVHIGRAVITVGFHNTSKNKDRLYALVGDTVTRQWSTVVICFLNAARLFW